MPEPIRVLHVIRLMNHGGVESMIMNLYRNIDRTKVQFDFVQNSNEPAVYDGEILALGGRIYHCPHYNGKNHFAYTKWWHEFFKAHPGEYPIVHGHLGSTAAIYLSIAKKYGSFAIAHSHSAGTGGLKYRVFSYPTRYVADHFFACSEDAGVVRYGKRVGNSERCQVLNNAIDTRKFAYSPEVRRHMRNSLHISPETPVIGHIGRFTEAKNHAYLLDIFERIHQENPSAMLLLVGDGELRQKIVDTIARKNLDGAVILAGTQDHVWDYYQTMDVFVFPSIYEGLGIVAIEAQTSGLPCIVSDSVPREAAVTDLLEFLPLENGPDVWCKKILSCIGRSRMSREAEIDGAGYNISTTAKWLENYYLKVVQNRG